MLKVFLDTLKTGTPIAILVACVGVALQWAHMLLRERTNDRQLDRELKLNEQKFQHEKQLEEKKFEYDKSRWREQLSREITVRLVEIRLEEYSRVWPYMERVAKSERAHLSTQTSKEIAQQIRAWRYSKGGLLAEELTRDAAYALQQLLDTYDGSDAAWRKIRASRKVFRNAIRADMGLSEEIYEITQERQKVRESLAVISAEMEPDNPKSSN